MSWIMGDRSVSLPLRECSVKSRFELLSLAAAILCLSSPDFGAAATVPRFAYVPNFKDNTLSLYTVNASTGQLRDNGYVVTGQGPGEVTLGGRFLYVSDFFANEVSAYRINTTQGALTRVAGSPFTAGTHPASLRVSAEGKFLFVANNGSNDISVYTINATSGALSPVAGSPFGGGAG